MYGLLRAPGIKPHDVPIWPAQPHPHMQAFLLSQPSPNGRSVRQQPGWPPYARAGREPKKLDVQLVHCRPRMAARRCSRLGAAAAQEARGKKKLVRGARRARIRRSWTWSATRCSATRCATAAAPASSRPRRRTCPCRWRRRTQAWRYPALTLPLCIRQAPPASAPLGVRATARSSAAIACAIERRGVRVRCAAGRACVRAGG